MAKRKAHPRTLCRVDQKCNWQNERKELSPFQTVNTLARDGYNRFPLALSDIRPENQIDFSTSLVTGCSRPSASHTDTLWNISILFFCEGAFCIRMTSGDEVIQPRHRKLGPKMSRGMARSKSDLNVFWWLEKSRVPNDITISICHTIAANQIIKNVSTLQRTNKRAK